MLSQLLIYNSKKPLLIIYTFLHSTSPLLNKCIYFIKFDGGPPKLIFNPLNTQIYIKLKTTSYYNETITLYSMVFHPLSKLVINKIRYVRSPLLITSHFDCFS